MRKLAPRTSKIVVADPSYLQVLNHQWDQQWCDAGDYLAWSIEWMAVAMRVLRD